MPHSAVSGDEREYKFHATLVSKCGLIVRNFTAFSKGADGQKSTEIYQTDTTAGKKIQLGDKLNTENIRNMQTLIKLSFQIKPVSFLCFELFC